MKKEDLIYRRELLIKTLKAGAELGLGAFALDKLSEINPSSANASVSTPESFLTFASAGNCVLTCQQTLGPCYYDTGLIRRNITEGKQGFAMTLAFRVVSVDTCEPIHNASIDIWHTDNNGVYSTPISAFCNGNDAIVQSQRFARGIQFTDTDGMAYFDTFYPGWYSGRTPHIHATIRITRIARTATRETRPTTFWAGA